MHKLLEMSWLNVKNVTYSKEFLLGLIAAFSYSMLWLLIVHPKAYGLDAYAFEFGRFLYVVILYAAVSILRNDIKSNSTKTIFTGVFSRTEIMISKAMALFILGIVFSVIVEINNVLASIILYKKIGLNGFLAFNHLQLFISYTAITLSMGSLMILIISILFNERKSILFFIVILSLINFYSSAVTVMVDQHPETVQSFSGYMMTPFYNTIALMEGYFTIQSVMINIVWAIIFYTFSTFIINRREIK